MSLSALNRFERRKERTRRLLQQAATELMFEKGYDAVSIQDITDRADVGRGTFYVHFRDKEDVVWSILREGFDQLDAQIAQIGGDMPFEVRAYHIWLTIFSHVDANKDLMRVVIGKKGHVLLANRLYDYLVEMLIRDLEPNIHRTPVKLPISFVANYLIGAQMRLIVWWLEQAPHYTPQQMAAMYYEMTIGVPAPVQLP